MRAQQIIHTWDYHHGQATRVIVAGLPPLRGTTMAEKQAYFAAHCDHVRTSVMQEPRGHTNMLGAVLTEPCSQECDVGMLFLSPQGFFAMCGDSTFSATAALIDSGMFVPPEPDGELELTIDTVAGPVAVGVVVRAGEPTAITFRNVPSYSLGEQALEIEGVGEITAILGYGGLTYAFVEARTVGIESLKAVGREELLDVGTRVLRSARAQTNVVSSLGPHHAGEGGPVDLVTLTEPLDGERGSRVANFYAPRTCGRTPSGTGLAARTAVEAAAGRLTVGDTYVHESPLGLRFTSRVAEAGIARADEGPSGIVAAVTARSFLMGTAQWVMHPEDPFQHGFVFLG